MNAPACSLKKQQSWPGAGCLAQGTAHKHKNGVGLFKEV